MYSQASLWSWLCAEASQVSFQCVNQILFTQTWYNGHFLQVILSQEYFTWFYNKSDFEELKNCVLVIFHSVFVGREKTFRVSCRHQTCIVRLLCDHTYTQKWTGSVLDTSMRWYVSKRELMAIFLETNTSVEKIPHFVCSNVQIWYIHIILITQLHVLHT